VKENMVSNLFGNTQLKGMEEKYYDFLVNMHGIVPRNQENSVSLYGVFLVSPLLLLCLSSAAF
jgi:hypothetical protein